MKKPISIILIFLLVSAIWAGSLKENVLPESQQNEITKQILKIHEEIKQTAENFDADALFEYVLDANDVIIENGLLRQTRKEALEITRQGLQGISELSYNYTHKNINIISADTVLWTGKGTTLVTLSDGRKLSNEFAETILYTLNDGQWKIMHAHRSSPNSN